MFTWTRRLLMAGAFLILLTTNLLTLTSVAFNAAVSGMMATALGVQTVAEVMSQRLASKDRVIKQQRAAAVKRKAAVRKFLDTCGGYPLPWYRSSDHWNCV